MREFLRKNLQAILGYISEIGLSISIIIIMCNLHNLPILISFSIISLIFIAFPIVFRLIANAIKKHAVIKTAEQEALYSPFPDITKDKGQSLVIQMMFEYLNDKYKLQPDLEVNPDGKLMIGVQMPQKNSEDLEFMSIDEVTLPEVGLKITSNEWKFAASAILEHFMETCKTVLGEIKE